jgi:hypothetical protein
MPDELHPVHSRHGQIAHDDVHRTTRVVQHCQGTAAIFGAMHFLRAHEAQEVDENFSLQWMIFHYKKTEV